MSPQNSLREKHMVRLLRNVKRKEFPFFHSTNRLDVTDNPTKFYQNISKQMQVPVCASSTSKKSVRPNACNGVKTRDLILACDLPTKTVRDPSKYEKRNNNNIFKHMRLIPSSYNTLKTSLEWTRKKARVVILAGNMPSQNDLHPY